ncbi:glycosyltransferase [Geodermatophilus sp. SYSU D00703]
MRLLFVHHVVEDRGSAQDMYHYALAARDLGHEVVLFGARPARSAYDWTRRVERADAVVFIFEWTTGLQHGDVMDLTRLIATVPRERRVVLDCDGRYNEAISVDGDENHPHAESSRRWLETCDALSDTICQPTLNPLRPNVRPFLFHAYHPDWEVPLEPAGKEFGMCYVGNNWFRWKSVRRVLAALEPIREEVGRIALIGHGWNTPAPWANHSINPDAYEFDADYLERLGVEVLPPVPFDEVVPQMGRGVFSPVVYRPLFDHLRLVTCRTFETVAAGTIPLFAQDATFVEEVYGPAAVELALPAEGAEDKVCDVLRRPAHYVDAVMEIRHRLAKDHSYHTRLAELLAIVEG